MFKKPKKKKSYRQQCVYWNVQ